METAHSASARFKKLRQKFEKPLDNKQILCYNKDVGDEARASLTDILPYDLPQLLKTLDIKHKMCYNVYENRGRKTSQTRKAFIMKKASLQSLYNFLTEKVDVCPEDIAAIREEIAAELAKGQAKAEANRALYASAHKVVIEVLRSATAPVTIGELYDAIAKDLPEDMSKGKIQYAITRLWTDEIAKIEGKVNTYTLKV